MSVHAGFAEKYLGINKLTPPPTHDVPSTTLSTHLSLGEYKLNLDQNTGLWGLHSDTFKSYIAEIDRLKALNVKLEADQAPLVNEKVQLKQRIQELEASNAELKFRNSVLINMCAIAEGDYMQLCSEAGVHPFMHENNFEEKKDLTQTKSLSNTIVLDKTVQITSKPQIYQMRV